MSEYEAGYDIEGAFICAYRSFCETNSEYRLHAFLGHLSEAIGSTSKENKQRTRDVPVRQNKLCTFDRPR